MDVLNDRHGPPAPGFADGSQIGKRYVSDSLGIELLCTKGGEGTLSVGDEVLALKRTAALPASD